VHVAAASLGLSAVFVWSPLAYAILKYAGAAYLVYLGLRMLMARVDMHVPGAAGAVLPPARVFGQSVLVEVLNPKTALFFLAFLPQFVDPAAGPVTSQVLVLGIVVTATALPCDFAVAFAAGGAARFLRGNVLALRIQRWLSGSILVGLGAWIMLARRGAD
jgi:threonine/homoserine/homoserine lactone efflux protein